MISDSRTASLAPFSTASRRPDITKMSSAPIGVMNADLRAIRRARFWASASCSASRSRWAASSSPAAHAVRASIPRSVISACLRSIPRTSGFSGRNQLNRRAIGQPPGSSFQAGRAIAAMMPAAGIVVSQATPISPTIPQPTCRQRRRPTPIPTIDVATTWVVLTGAPAIEAARMTPALARLAHEPVEAAQWEDPSPDRPDDRPATEGGPEREGERARHGHADRGRQVARMAARDEQRGDDPDRLLGVVRAVAERQPGRRDPLGPRGRDCGTGSSPGPSPEAQVARGRGPRGSRDTMRGTAR